MQTTAAPTYLTLCALSSQAIDKVSEKRGEVRLVELLELDLAVAALSLSEPYGTLFVHRPARKTD